MVLTDKNILDRKRYLLKINRKGKKLSFITSRFYRDNNL